MAERPTWKLDKAPCPLALSAEVVNNVELNLSETVRKPPFSSLFN